MLFWMIMGVMVGWVIVSRALEAAENPKNKFYDF